MRASNPFALDPRAIVAIMRHCWKIDGLDSSADAGRMCALIGLPRRFGNPVTARVARSKFAPDLDGMRWSQRLVVTCEMQSFGNASALCRLRVVLAARRGRL
ncbi:hypothetical protein KR96_17265 [Ralstonia solanacearum]|nr:hypothetical protein KR96_17265 [Ralstonia solanacearum]